MFDVVKALMMLWVVWGHLGLYGIVGVPNGDYPYMQNLKIGVNMPVFFVISGYFAASTFSRGSWSKVVARAIGFLWPQTALAATVAFCGLLLSADVRDSVEYLLSIWFLRTMLVVYVFAAFAYKVFKSDVVRWAAMLGIYGLMIFLPKELKSFWIGQSAHMFPYFVFGLMVLRKNELHKRIWPSLVCGFLLVLAVLLEGGSLTSNMSFWKGATHWEDLITSAENLVAFFARTTVGIAGSVFILFVIDRLLRLIPCASALGVVGQTTMGVYVLHEIILIKVATLPAFPMPIWTHWFVAIAYLMACHVVVLMVKRNDFSRFLFFGDEKRTESLVNSWARSCFAVASRLRNR